MNMRSRRLEHQRYHYYHQSFDRKVHNKNNKFLSYPGLMPWLFYADHVGTNVADGPGKGTHRAPALGSQ